MKVASIVVIAALMSAAGAATAGRCTINGVSSSKCPPPPMPPAAPSLAMAPLPLLPAMPPMPDMPAPPAPPAPPPLIDAPAEAHAACAGKPVGSSINWTVSRNEKLSGTCERDNRGMYFEVNSVRRVRQ